MVRGHLFNPPAGVPSAADLFLRLRSLPARVGTVDCLMLVVCGLRLCVAPAGGAAAGRGAAGMHNGPRPAGDFPAWGGRDVPDVCRLAELGQERARASRGNEANPWALLVRRCARGARRQADMNRRGTSSPRAGAGAQRLLRLAGVGAGRFCSKRP